MINQLNSLLTCITVFLLASTLSLNAQSKKKNDQKSDLHISKILLDGEIPPFYIQSGGMYQLYLEAEGEATFFYWAVYLDMDGNRGFDESEQLWHAEGIPRGQNESLIAIPKEWSQRHTLMRIIVSDEPIYSPERIGGNFDNVDIQALIPFTSQIDTGLDEMMGGCIEEDETSTSLSSVTLNITIPAFMVPTQYEYVDVHIYGYDPTAAPLIFGNSTTSYTTSLEPVPGGRFATISLTIPLSVNLASINEGNIASLNECDLIFFMEVRGYKTYFSTPEIFYVEIDEEVFMPSIEYVVAPLCDCENSGTQILRLSAEARLGNIELFPNPANDYLNLIYESKDKVDVSIRNINGQLIWKRQLPAGNIRETISLSQFSKGLYIFELSSAEKRQRFKILKH